MQIQHMHYQIYFSQRCRFLFQFSKEQLPAHYGVGNLSLNKILYWKATAQEFVPHQSGHEYESSPLRREIT